jgi:hypothetical protein
MGSVYVNGLRRSARRLVTCWALVILYHAPSTLELPASLHWLMKWVCMCFPCCIACISSFLRFQW